jgi:integrase
MSSAATAPSRTKITDAKLRVAKKGAGFRERGLEWRFFKDGEAGVRLSGRVKGGARTKYTLPLGRYPTLGLGEARKLAEEARKLAAQGVDPSLHRQQVVKAQADTVGVAVQRYLEAEQTSEKTRKDKRSAFKNALVKLQDLPIRDLRKADVALLLDGYLDRPAQHKKLYLYLSHFMSWCVERDLIEHNFVKDIRSPRTPKAREIVLTNSDIKDLFCDDNTTWGWMLQIALLTAQRGGEVSAMRRSEIDLEGRTWTIPKTVLKQRRTHVVVLSDFAVSLIKQAMEQRPAGWGDFIFGVGSFGQKPYGGRSNGMKAVRRRQSADAGWRGHDTRRTTVTMMQRLGIPQEVRNRVTGQSGAKTGATPYERYDFIEEARDAVKKVEHEIRRIVYGGDKVVSLRDVALRP